MSFDNYYCELEEDDCFAIIPYHSLINKNGHMDQYKFIDILVFCKKLIFRIYEINDKHAIPNISQPRDLHKICLYITFTIEEDNLFNNQIIVDLYGITPIKINKDNIWEPTIYSEYINEIIKNISGMSNHHNYSFNSKIIKDVTYSKQTMQNGINLNAYDFEGYFINHFLNKNIDSLKVSPHGHDDISFNNYYSGDYKFIYKTQTYPQTEETMALDTMLFFRHYDEDYIHPCHTIGQHFHGRANLKNVLIYKLYHLCKDLREKHTKKEIHYATLEDKMAEMQTEIRIKDTYTAETEQIRIDILDYKEKCNKLVNKNAELVKKCNNYAMKCNKLEMTNAELVKKCDSYEMSTNIHIENISKELKLLCKSIELMNHASNF